MQSELFQDTFCAINWNPHIWPFSLKVNHDVNIPSVNQSTDISNVSNDLQFLSSNLEGYSGNLRLFVFEFNVTDGIWVNYYQAKYTYKVFCDAIKGYLQGKVQPSGYCLECIENYEKPVREEVVKVIEKEQLMKDLA